MVYNYMQHVHSILQNEVEFCKATDLLAEPSIRTFRDKSHNSPSVTLIDYPEFSTSSINVANEIVQGVVPSWWNKRFTTLVQCQYLLRSLGHTRSGTLWQHVVRTQMAKGVSRRVRRCGCGYGPPGPTGPKGRDGKDGVDGVPGSKGEPGIDASSESHPQSDICF
uniref:Uncharacterized protein n=1 Tax=Parascaris equorum TaxID=6256 RepID=A0A914RR58_PAREQ